ncbi:MAG: SDR family oxidoreductase [Erysipelotrichaceae bacterium]|nr:SDR family oxidoreductase [Erysipelotrichaceae bacterium]
MFDFTGKKILVTGSSSGIGKAIALEFARHHGTVFVHASRSMEKAQGVCEEIRKEVPDGDVTPIVADFLRDDIADVLYEQTGDIDILVQNVSIQYRIAWDEITDEQFADQINVNLRSSLKLTQKYAPYMKEQGWGRIIYVGSIQQHQPHPMMAIYAASKDGQMSLVKNLGKQLAPYGITVNCMSPGTILTPRNEKVLEVKEYYDACIRGIPAGRLGKPSDCAGAVLLLASEEGSFINGVELLVDGGAHLL